MDSRKFHESADEASVMTDMVARLSNIRRHRSWTTARNCDKFVGGQFPATACITGCKEEYIHNVLGPKATQDRAPVLKSSRERWRKGLD
jgi:hypothetical protein